MVSDDKKGFQREMMDTVSIMWWGKKRVARELLSEWGHHPADTSLSSLCLLSVLGLGCTCSQSNEKAAHRVFRVNVLFEVSI